MARSSTTSFESIPSKQLSENNTDSRMSTRVHKVSERLSVYDMYAMIFFFS